MAKKKDLKASIEDEIQKMLAATESPDEGRMKLLALGIKMCALNAKLEESDYGGFFGDGDDEEKTVISKPNRNFNASPRVPAKEP